VNLLRATVAAFAAGVGGADAVTIQAYDTLREAGGSELGRRLARNTQAMLIEESNLAQVIDPAGGSWYVETLTDELAKSAWAWFQELDRTGGIVEAFGAGLVQQRIGSTWERRRKNIARRKDPITGVTEFPNIDEEPPPGALESPTHNGSATKFAPLVSVLYAEPFEATRSRSDRHLVATGTRPAVFLANLGPLAAHTARTTFAKNLFEVGGIRVVSGSGDPAALAAELAASGTTVACICSNDATYSDDAADATRTLVAAGATRVLLAGRPGDLQAELDAAGVAGAIYAGCDVLAILGTTLDHLGVGS
jgi:methylmalonyl-CoA mutase